MTRRIFEFISIRFVRPIRCMDASKTSTHVRRILGLVDLNPPMTGTRIKNGLIESTVSSIRTHSSTWHSTLTLVDHPPIVSNLRIYICTRGSYGTFGRTERTDRPQLLKSLKFLRWVRLLANLLRDREQIPPIIKLRFLSATTLLILVHSLPWCAVAPPFVRIPLMLLPIAITSLME